MPDLTTLLAGTPAGDLVETLRSRPVPPSLGPADTWNPGLNIASQRASALLAPKRICSAEFANALKSGLLLWNDQLDASHTLSQDIHSRTGSYWHGIMHRREPDYGNSKYWMRRVDTHPIFPELREAAGKLAAASEQTADVMRIAQAIADQSEWDSFAMVDWCEAANRGRIDAQSAALLRRIQLAEIELLLTYSAEQAIG
jgi:hypothetical protein